MRGRVERDVTPPKGPDPLMARLTGGEAPATEPQQEEAELPSTPPEVDSPEVLEPEVLDACKHPDGFGATAERPDRFCIHCGELEAPDPSLENNSVDRGDNEGSGQEPML